MKKTTFRSGGAVALLVAAGLAIAACGQSAPETVMGSVAEAVTVDKCAGVVCTASDACHLAGVCDPGSGQCSNPNQPDGLACNDGNPCTTGDTCHGGNCQGMNVPDHTVTCDDGNVCTSGDVCQGGHCQGQNVPDHTVTCDDDNVCTSGDMCQGGHCQGQNVPDHTVTCDDGNACTSGDVCQGGHCQGQNVPDNTVACNDGNACTYGDVCQGGNCKGTAVTCGQPDQCHPAGLCDPATGACRAPPALADGTQCNLNNPCTQNDVCKSGVCSPGTPKQNGSGCNSGNPCTHNDSCQNGNCVAGPAVQNGSGCNSGNPCTDHDACQNGVCVAGTPKQNGAGCNAGNPCTNNDSCQNGNCAAGTPKADGSSCNTGNHCVGNQACKAGQCVGTATSCVAIGPCWAAVCDPQQGTCSNTPSTNGNPSCTVAAAPTNVAASQGTSTDYVLVTFTGSTGALSYNVYRDGALAGEVAQAPFMDMGALAGGVPLAPTGLTASQGTSVNGVTLAWSGASGPPGATHVYTVTAVDYAGESAQSRSAGGYRAAWPITDYQLAFDAVGYSNIGAGTTYTDLTAAAPTVTPGNATATQGTSPLVVTAMLSGQGANAGASRTYRVRAVNAAGAGADSQTAIGYRGVGALAYQWERSTADSDAGYFALVGANGTAVVDTTALPNGAARYYRCQVSAAGAATSPSTAARGYRQPQAGQLPRNDAAGPGQIVYSLLEEGSSLYVGGMFSAVGPVTSSYVVADPVTGQIDSSWPAATGGLVRNVIDDGSGGYYLSGSFQNVGGLPRGGLVHILANHRVDPVFVPDPVTYAGTVASTNIQALALANGNLFVGGSFDHVGAAARANFVVVDATTGATLPISADTDGTVNILEAFNGAVYAGGYFTNVGGQPRGFMAAFDASTGQVLPFSPGISGRTTNHVDAIVPHNGLLYIGGAFTNFNGVGRNFGAAIDPASGAVAAWNPNANNLIDTIAFDASAAYVGGTFSTVGGQSHFTLAAVDPTSGAPLALQADTNNAFVYSLAVLGSTLYVGSTFGVFHGTQAIGGQPRNGVAAIDLGSGLVNGWDPEIGGPVDKILASNGTILIAGSTVGAPAPQRKGLAVVDHDTGALLPWVSPSDGAVDCMAASGNVLFTGGNSYYYTGAPLGPSFYRASGVDLTTGATLFNPTAPTSVAAATAINGVFYVGGAFTSIGGTARSRMAAYDTSGNLLSFAPTMNGTVSALTAVGTILYAGGSFSTVNGQTRSGLAAFDTTTGALLPWNPGVTGSVSAIAAAPGGLIYVGGSFSAAGGAPHANAAVIDSTGNVLPWNPATDNVVEAIVTGGNIVYVGGYFKTFGGQTRMRLAAVEASSQTLLEFNASIDDGIVYALAVDGDTLHVGGNFQNVSGNWRPYLAALPPSP